MALRPNRLNPTLFSTAGFVDDRRRLTTVADRGVAVGWQWGGGGVVAVGWWRGGGGVVDGPQWARYPG